MTPYERRSRQRVAAAEEDAGDPHFLVAVTALARHPGTAIVCLLATNPHRFSEVLSELAHVPEETVSTALRELDGDGLVLYGLTPRGSELAPSLHVLSAWAAPGEPSQLEVR